MLDARRETLGPQPLDGEMEALAVLAGAVQASGAEVERAALVNLYVALKSKPLALLVGPVQSGKIAVLRSLAGLLTGGDALRGQFMPGHAWWASQSGNVALYTRAQARLNTCKLLALLEEAHAPENVQRVVLACLTRISPAEVVTIFAATAFQLRHGELMRLGAAHFTEPVAYPRNMLLAGTLDAPLADDLEAELLAMTNVIEWPAGQAANQTSARLAGARTDFGREFLASMVRHESAARFKLKRIVKQSLTALWPLACLESILQQHVPGALPAIRSDLLIYLANAFSRSGTGLFEAWPVANLEVALDWAVATVIVPRLRGPLPQGRQLRAALLRVCDGRWPRAARGLEAAPGLA